jgi:hypothetical protein
MSVVAAAAALWLGTASADSSRTLSAGLRSTSTSVSCTPSSIELTETATCTAVVSDTDTGAATTPTGTVDFSATSDDAFANPASCTLSGGSCQITYTAYGFAPSTATVTASYGGDSSHSTSSGMQDIAVNPYTGPGPIPPPPFHPPVVIAGSHERPVAGQVFRGVVVTLVARPPLKISGVLCDAQVGRTHLRALKRTVYSGTHKRGIACSWRIPAGSAGKHLHLWNAPGIDYPKIYYYKSAFVFTSDGQEWSGRAGPWVIKY